MSEKQNDDLYARFEYIRGHAEGFEKGYEMGFKTQPDLNRKYMAKQIEELKKRAKRWEELAKR